MGPIGQDELCGHMNFKKSIPVGIVEVGKIVLEALRPVSCFAMGPNGIWARLAHVTRRPMSRTVALRLDIHLWVRMKWLIWSGEWVLTLWKAKC